MNAYLFCFLWDATVLITSMYMCLQHDWIAIFLLVLLKFPTESDDE